MHNLFGLFGSPPPPEDFLPYSFLNLSDFRDTIQYVDYISVEARLQQVLSGWAGYISNSSQVGNAGSSS
jgi:hypothetical protein